MTMAASIEAPPSSPRPQRPTRRAKIACKSCNARRVKCDVSESQPCWHCRMRQKPCELIESRRGRYPRPRHGTSVNKSAESKAAVEPAVPVEGTNTSVSSETSPQWRHNSIASIDVEALRPPMSPVSLVEPTRKLDPSDSMEGPEMLFARMTEVQSNHDSPPNIREQTRTLYLGETFTLAFVVKTVCSPTGRTSEIRNHYPIPAFVAERDDPSRSLSKHEEDFLQAQGCFTTLPQDLSDEMIAVFFRDFHPAWPVFDRRLFATLHERNQVSLLVLQTIYFISVSICNDDLLSRAGFADRYQARRVFYLRAKALYDADYEKDKVILAAVLLILGFWWQGPEDQKDTWHWVGSAITLAQTLGMHRSTARSDIDPRQRSLWKRIFWSIYARDRHAAAALGRPFRIQDDECDVEELCDADFEWDVVSNSRIIPEQQNYHVQYPIAMSTLAVTLGKIIRTRYYPKSRNTNADTISIGNELDKWKANLPQEMLLQEFYSVPEAGFWAWMLHSNFYTCQILLFRPSRVIVETEEEVQHDAIARAAANAQTRIAEELLTSGTLRQGQVHLAPALFAACSIHAIILRRKDAIHSQVAENRARQCMLALSELAKSWPVAGWILRLFISLMTRLTGHDFDIDPKLGVLNRPSASSNAVFVQQPRVANPSSTLYEQQAFQTNTTDYEQQVTQQISQVRDPEVPWSMDLGSEDLGWIFQDSLEGFSLYDFSAPTDSGNLEF